MKYIFILLLLLTADNINNEKIWIYIMAGQSNMSGRALIYNSDTFTSPRILMIDEHYKLIKAQEPLHRYESNQGLDCGMSFANRLLNRVPKNVTILFVPCAISGTSIDEWLNDKTHKNIKLLSNFKDKIEIASRYGTVKGILWHQGEADANEKGIVNYEIKLKLLFDKFRIIANVPIYSGEIGVFTNKRFGEYTNEMNIIIRKVNENLVQTNDFIDVGDSLHFDSKSERLFGIRLADKIKL